MATNDKKVFLYVGRKSKNVKYNSYTNADLQSVNADEFVLTSANYDDYLDYPSEMNEYVNDVFNLAKQVIQATGKFVWLGIPRPPEPKSQITIAEYTGYANQYLNTFVVPIRDKLKALMASNGYDYYYNYVQGFYMSDEHVRRKTFTYPDASGENEDDPNGVDTNTSNLLAHPQIKMYSIISDKLKTSEYGWKKFLWCPYAGRGKNYDTTFIDIAYIANTTDIFDTVLIQPGVFVHYNPDRDPGSASVLKNLDVIRNSMNIQEVRTRDAAGNTNNRVVAKRSSTKIGCQMEVSPFILHGGTNGTSQQYQSAFQQTVNALKGNKVTVASDRHFSFYCDDRNSDWPTLIDDYVNPFFATL